ncbi:MAG: hypothetical protein WBE86_11340 [Candidatus Acidiferrales bacterium]
MKAIALATTIIIFVIAPSAFADHSKTVPMTCEAAIHEAEAVVVAQKHGYKEPGPQDMVLKITSSNVGKTVGAAVIFPPALLWSHPKFGALTFSASTDGKSCIVKSTGQPADQALKDWDKDSN